MFKKKKKGPGQLQRLVVWFSLKDVFSYLHECMNAAAAVVFVKATDRMLQAA